VTTRRTFLNLLGGAAATWPLAGQAQQPSQQIRRVGVLVGGAESDPEQAKRLSAFKQGLRELGWVEGHNIIIETRYTSGEPARAQKLAKEFVNSRQEVILAATTSVVAAVRRETTALPIVFVVVSDPIGSGFVENLARPGGNVTGFLNIEDTLGGKWLGLLREIAPRVRHVALMFNPDVALQSYYYIRPFQHAARSMGAEPTVAHVRNADDIAESIGRLGNEGDAGLIVMPDFFLSANRRHIIAQTTRHGVPAVYPYPFFARDGGLISYGVDLSDSYRQAAIYVDRIFKGAKPADLPVQQPTKFELVINLPAAKALGLTVPPSLLARADEVIE
jgi:putative ABC transport system substrate-binding protein